MSNYANTDSAGNLLGSVTVVKGRWTTKTIGTSATATVSASELGLEHFNSGQRLIVESIGTLLLRAADSGWSENWTNDKDTNPLERAVGNVVVVLQSNGDTLFLRDEGIPERGAPTQVTVSVPLEVRL
jgi:hypothetical protein